MRGALVNLANGLGENTIEYIQGYAPATGYTVIQSDTAGIGDTWDGTKFIAAPILDSSQ